MAEKITQIVFVSSSEKSVHSLWPLVTSVVRSVQLQFLTLIFNLLLTYLQVNKVTMRTKVSIPETIRQDKGSYMLTAENCFGKAQHTIHVEILGKK